jgi:type IV secretion system protein VirD4
MLHAPLTERGEVFRILNIGGMHLDILGEGDFYNPLSVILAENFKRAGGLADVSSDAEEMSLQLYPEPTSGGEDKFWRDGTRDFMGFSMQQSVLVNGDAATLGDVCQLLGDRERLLKEALWAAGRLEGEDGTLPAMPLESSPWVSRHAPQDVENYIAHYRTKAGSIADLLAATDSKTSDSFLTGARQALSPFNITTRAAKVMSKSTFRFGDMKEGENATTVSIIIDASRLATQSKIAGLLQWCAMTEWKRHANKHRPVYIIHDETTNGKINDLPSLQTSGREYGIKWHGFIQSLAAYEAVYGKQAVSTLLSETEIKQFLPNQRDPDTLALIEKLLGEQSIVTKNHNGNRDRFGISGFAYQEEAKPLMRAEQIRRTDKTILFIRNNRPILSHLPSIAEIAPWRKQIGINPFYGKPYLKRVKLRLRKRKGVKP